MLVWLGFYAFGKKDTVPLTMEHNSPTMVVFDVTQKNQPASQFQVTAPFQSHYLPLNYKIL